MDPKLNESSSDSDSDQIVVSESLPRSSSSSDETTGFGSEAKRQKVEEDDEKSEDDIIMEAEQVAPLKAETTLKTCCPEDDEGFQSYVKKLEDSEGFDLDEDPPQHYLGAGFGLGRVHLDKPYHAEHAAIIRRCINRAIKRLDKDLTYVETVSANVGVELGLIYFITFLARDSSSEVKAYQTKIVRDPWDELEIKMFREKPQQQQQQEPQQ